MRAKRLSDASWSTLQSRVLGMQIENGKLVPRDDLDPRLRLPPFSEHPVQFIVHRHSLRAALSLANALRTCTSKNRVLYLAMASDSVANTQAHLFTDRLRCRLLRMANGRHTDRLPSMLPLYLGMRLLLASKDCRRLGLMHGAEVRLEQIFFADAEELPKISMPQQPVVLKYLPAALLLRAEDVLWTLPRTALPHLPDGVDRTGRDFVMFCFFLYTCVGTTCCDATRCSTCAGSLGLNTTLHKGSHQRILVGWGDFLADTWCCCAAMRCDETRSQYSAPYSGLFLLLPRTGYFHVKEADVNVKVRRIQLSTFPADTRVVYSAQGETWDAVVADLLRPPRMPFGVHWLACYVMLSRSRSLEGFLALRMAQREELEAGAPQYLLSELDRLLTLEQSGTTRLQAFYARLSSTLPAAMFKSIMQLCNTGAAEEQERATAQRREEDTVAASSLDGGERPKRPRLWRKTTPHLSGASPL